MDTANLMKLTLPNKHRQLIVTGVGSRRISNYFANLIHELSFSLANKNYKLRSGMADGCDIAFEIGFYAAGGDVELWAPWRHFKNRQNVGFIPNEKHFEIARTVHPIFDKLKRYEQFLHARNVGQILGEDCNTKTNLVICWTPDGCESKNTCTKKTGGTGTAITLADRLNIPIFNLKNTDCIPRLFDYFKRNLHYPNHFNEFYEEGIDYVLPKNMLFVFGSNLAGRHGKGAALTAKNKYGAIYGIGKGQQGNAYAIATKDEDLVPLPLEKIKQSINEFIKFTQLSGYTFYVTPLGTGLAGYSQNQIAPLFKGVENCWLPKSWMPYLL